jgi:hypothetical protein
LLLAGSSWPAPKAYRLSFATAPHNGLAFLRVYYFRTTSFSHPGGLPLGGRINIEPWNDQLQMLKSKPVGAVAEYEKVPFEITPMLFYLTRQEASSAAAPEAISAKSDTETKPLDEDAK